MRVSLTNSLGLILLLSGSFFYTCDATAQESNSNAFHLRLDAAVYAIANSAPDTLRPNRPHVFGFGFQPTFTYSQLSLSIESHVITTDTIDVTDPELKIAFGFGETFRQDVAASVAPLPTSSSSKESERFIATTVNWNIAFNIVAVDFELGVAGTYHGFENTSSDRETIYDLFPASMTNAHTTAISAGNVVFPWQLGVSAKAQWQLPASVFARFDIEVHEWLGTVTDQDQLSGVSRISRYPRLQRTFSQIVLGREFSVDTVTLIPTVGWSSVFAPKTPDNRTLRLPVLQTSDRLADGGPFLYVGLRYPLAKRQQKK